MKSLELLPWVRIPHRRDVPDTMLCDKVCEWLAASRWFSPGTPVSSTNKTDRHDIAEILLKVALNIKTLTPSSDLYLIVCCLLYILYIHENKYTTNNKSCFSKKVALGWEHGRITYNWSCNRPTLTTPNTPLLPRSNLKLSFMSKGLGILQTPSTQLRPFLRASCVLKYI
jgi:hypothetical protein